MRWAGHVAHMRAKRKVHTVLAGSQKVEDIDVGRRIVLKCILEKLVGVV
jgi:hypothetical protein